MSIVIAILVPPASGMAARAAAIPIAIITTRLYPDVAGDPDSVPPRPVAPAEPVA